MKDDRPGGQFAVRLPADMLDALREVAEAEERSVAQIIRFAVREYLDDR